MKRRLHEVPTEKSSPINDQRAQAGEASGENCAADLDRQHRTSAAATGLEARLNELPTEILDLVRDAFFDQEFGPKEVLAPSSIPDVRLFGAMNKKLYAKYHDIFLSGNTWVIETGNFDTTDFLLHIPGRMRQKIHKVAIRLSPEDISYASIDSWLRGHPDLVKRSFGDFSNVLYEFYKDCREINDMLYSVWSGKLTDIFKLSESVHLTLDMRDAYGIDGEYLGLRLAHRMACWFQDDDDAPLTVRVPNDVLGEQLRNAIGDNVKYLDEQVVMNTNLE